MSTKRISIVCVLLMAVALLAACAPTGTQRMERTTKSMGQARGEMVKGKQQVNATMASLNRLALSQGGDLVTKYDDFTKQYKSTTIRAQNVRNSINAVNSHRDSYLNAWAEDSKNVQSPEIRRRTQQRQAEVSREFSKITTELEGVGAAYRPLMSELNDIHTHLSNDLNPRGVAAVRDIIKKANYDARVVTSRIDRAVGKMDQLNAELAPRGSMK